MIYKDALAFGDNVNDLSMFEVVGHPVVMGNASDKVKTYGKETTLTNDQQGVAFIINKL